MNYMVEFKFSFKKKNHRVCGIDQSMQDQLRWLNLMGELKG